MRPAWSPPTLRRSWAHRAVHKWGGGRHAPIYSVYNDAEVRSSFPVSGAARRPNPAGEFASCGRHLGCHASRRFRSFVDSPLKPAFTWPAELCSISRASDTSGNALVRLPVRFLKMNETVVWAAPVELFSEIAINITNTVAFPSNVLLRIHERLVRLSADSGCIRRRRIRADDVSVHGGCRGRPDTACPHIPARGAPVRLRRF